MIHLSVCFLLLLHFVTGEDICQNVNCGSGICIRTQNPALPYFCRCPAGTNTILPCPSENPCSRNPCGSGTCEVMPSLLHGYLCRCAGDAISLTSCNVTRSGCYSNPCINGLCIEGLASYFCNCLPTWTGKLCDEQITSPCSKNPCNPGKCLQLNEPNIPFVCLCPNGQFGLSCRMFGYLPSTARIFTTAITTTTTTTTTTMRTTTNSLFTCDPYDSRSCMNGGRCLQAANNYRCLCKPGYTGVFCDMNINECASNPCQYGGVCYDLQASYICYCQDGSFRSRCLPRAITTSTARTLLCPCQNGGVCSRIGSQICVCPIGYAGRFCEHMSTVAAVSNCNGVQCINGGTCYGSTSDSARCLCKNGFTGRYCETAVVLLAALLICVCNLGASANPYGMLLSRSCPISLRFNFQADRCDYAQNVKCQYQ
ncbi:unnamed protein product [Adineta ricciae]|uniref:EGF-like domain-containing protein n=1 Tax=Adineta ricciae TaxID=249248 RepID=A0A815BUG8_ADIRI|nr:unnamed protein product [Adineta ricciae]